MWLPPKPVLALLHALRDCGAAGVSPVELHAAHSHYVRKGAAAAAGHLPNMRLYLDAGPALCQTACPCGLLPS